jgi:uncharacterized FAD-dependent dehydrogenase
VRDAGAVFLATGHSARETYASLRAQQVPMEGKDFAVGVRVEHPSAWINAARYGEDYERYYPGIETAQYAIARTWKEEERAVYSFCMCPGGYVLNAATSVDGVVTNGMSNSQKSGRFSNAAFVVNVSQLDLARMGFDGVEAGIAFQRDVEARCRSAVNAGGMNNTVPAQRLVDFVQGSKSVSVGAHSCLNPVATASVHELLPGFVSEGIRQGLIEADRKMRGFASHCDALVYAPETRTSSPCRILRSPDNCTSPAHPAIYPVGEGAGYAGGITSAAVDGIRCAESFIQSLL